MDNARKETNKLALAACDADAAARELLKPTDEERVRAAISFLHKMACPHPIATLLESLLADNKALREQGQGFKAMKGTHDPSTHVAVPRDELAEIYWLCGSGDKKAEMKIEAKVSAMLSASEKEGE